jgi:hypothetical protein
VRRESVPIGFVDLCFSADKSVALAWAFAPTEAERNAIAQAHRDAVERAMAYIAREIGQARKGRGGQFGAEPGHVGWIAFDHYASRPTLEIARMAPDGTPETELLTLKVAGDPNLHTHVAVPNVVLTDNGRVGSLDLQQLNGRVHEFGAYYQANLAQNLRRLRVAVVLDRETGAVRLPTIPQRVRMAFSKRTHDAAEDARAYAAKIGQDWDSLSPDEKIALVKSGAFASRRSKSDDCGDFQAWRRQAIALRWQHRSVLGTARSAPEPDAEKRTEIAYKAALPLLEAELARRSVLIGPDARVAAARGLIASGLEGPQDIDRVTRAFRERGVRQDGRDTTLLWGYEPGGRHISVTTALHVDQERELVRLARTAAADGSAALPANALERAIAQSGLDFAGAHGRTQLQAIRRLGTGGRLGVAIGAAGAGKTTILQPLVEAWHVRGSPVYGIALAWRQGNDLAEAGIAKGNTLALAAFIRRANLGSLSLGRNSVVVVDELGLLGARQTLGLLRLRERHGFQMVAVGDPRQCQAIEAGPAIGLLREALGKEAVPELLTTVRQQTAREREITALFREGRAREALERKCQDGTAEVVPGGYREAVERAAALWEARHNANRDDTRFALTVSAPTNTDAREIAAAIRSRRRTMGELQGDARVLKAIDQNGATYDLPIAIGDRVRLFDRVGASFGAGRGGVIGHNGSVLDVLDVREEGLRLRNASGKDGLVKWDSLRDPATNRIRLTYGDVLTINTAQGLTSTEHIDVMPAGTRAVNAFKSYVAESRHRRTSWLITSDGAERGEIMNRRPLGDPRPIENRDVWENVARNLSRQPEKASALTFLRRAQQVRRGAARGLQRGLHPGEARAARGEEETTLHRAFARQRLARCVHQFAERMQSATWRTTAFGRFTSLAPAVRSSAITRFERILPALKALAERAGLGDHDGEHQGRRLRPGRRAR